MTKPTEAQIESAQVPLAAQPFLPWIHEDQLTCRQVAILLTVRENPGLSTGAIAKLLDLHKPTITRTADKLVQMGLLRRMTNSFDRRMVELWPASKKGRRNV